MKYFLPLNLPWQQASIELRNYVFSQFDVSKLVSWTKTNTADVLSKCPGLAEITKPLNATISYIAFVVYHKYNQSVIHVDADFVNESRIIMPILNCDGSETAFYSTNSTPVERKQPNGIPFYYYNEDNCKIVDKFSLDEGLFLFRIKEPHNVIMPVDKSNFPRISCTIALYPDLIHLLD